MYVTHAQIDANRMKFSNQVIIKGNLLTDVGRVKIKCNFLIPLEFFFPKKYVRKPKIIQIKICFYKYAELKNIGINEFSYNQLVDDCKIIYFPAESTRNKWNQGV